MQFLFSDEAHFCAQGSQANYVYHHSSKLVTYKHINPFTKVEVMFWRCFSSCSPGHLHICEGMMKLNSTATSTDSRVARELQQLFSDDDGIFQQDLTLYHTSKKTIKKLKDMNTIVMY